MKPQLKRALLRQLREWETQASDKMLNSNNDLNRHYQAGKAEAYQTIRHMIADLKTT